MIWLLKLYPPRWRRRYGEELTELVAARPFSVSAAVDLMAGAIDAWFHPQFAPAGTSNVKGDVVMIARALQLKCAGYGPDVTGSDKVKSTWTNIGGSLVLSALWLWALSYFGKSVYLMAIWPMAYFLPYLVSLRFTSLKGRSAGTQAILIAGLGATLTGFFLLVELLGSRVFSN
jgi:hypothetical protein